MIYKIYSFMLKIINGFTIRKNEITVGSNLIISGLIRVKSSGKSKISIGNNCFLNSSWRSNPSGGEKITLYVGKNGQIVFGNNVGISNSTIVSFNKVVLEDNVLIGNSCSIYDTDFHSIDYEYRQEILDTHIKTRPVIIEEGAFIGAHTIILKGTIIGKHSIIGAGSVVTKDIPAGEIWAGNPVKFIRRIET